jgi:hypothetical protein
MLKNIKAEIGNKTLTFANLVELHKYEQQHKVIAKKIITGKEGK